MTAKPVLRGDAGLAAFQRANCNGCYFADKPKIGTGLPCCTFGFKLNIIDNGTKCLTKRETETPA